MGFPMAVSKSSPTPLAQMAMLPMSNTKEKPLTQNTNQRPIPPQPTNPSQNQFTNPPQPQYTTNPPQYTTNPLYTTQPQFTTSPLYTTQPQHTSLSQDTPSLS